MKSLKSLLALGIAIAVSGTSFAETTDPLSAAKDAAKTQVSAVKTSATEAATSAKDAAKSKVTSAKTTATEAATSAKDTAKSKADSAKTAATTALAGKVNINTADAKTLQTLSGIGEAKAQAIINYRNQNGKIKDLAELSQVSGIGEATLQKIQSSISF